MICLAKQPIPSISRRVCLLNFLAIFSLLETLSTVVEATKHTFHTKHDPRLLIGPIGPTPFGLLQNGVYNITVDNYRLVVSNEYEEKKAFEKAKKTRKKEKASAPAKEEWQVDYKQQIPTSELSFEAAFVLAKFRTFAEFIRFIESMTDNGDSLQSTSCAFDLWNTPSGGVIRASDNTKLIPHDLENSYSREEEKRQDQAERNAIILRVPQSDPHGPMVHVFNDKLEEGEYYLFYQVCIVPPINLDKSTEILELLHHYRIGSTFELEISMYNVLRHGSGTEMISYLPAGDMPLPKLYLLLTILYMCLSIFWIRFIHSKNNQSAPNYLHASTKSFSSNPSQQTHHIHYIMFVLLLLKSLSLLAESIRFHYIRIRGHTAFWSILYYVLAFLKSTTLFTTLLLIGSGWSFVKLFLEKREKRILWVVLSLQVMTNLVIIILSADDQGEQNYDDWMALLHFMDIVCCAAVLFPIVWQVHSLESMASAANEMAPNHASHSIGAASDADHSSSDELSDGYYDSDNELDEAVPKEQFSSHEIRSLVHEPLNQYTTPLSLQQKRDLESLSPEQWQEKRMLLKKLRLFRTFYIALVGYIYMTRIVVFILKEHLSFRLTWIEPCVVEVTTLSFYLWVGYTFRPRQNNSLFERISKNADNDDSTTSTLMLADLKRNGHGDAGETYRQNTSEIVISRIKGRPEKATVSAIEMS